MDLLAGPSPSSRTHVVSEFLIAFFDACASEINTFLASETHCHRTIMAALSFSVAQRSPCLSATAVAARSPSTAPSSSPSPLTAGSFIMRMSCTHSMNVMASHQHHQLLQAHPRPRLCVRAQAQKDPDVSNTSTTPKKNITSDIPMPQVAKALGNALKESVQSTKQEVTADSVTRNMEENTSERKSMLGMEPQPGSLYPRPESERRPETGERSFTNFMSVDGAGPETINGRLAMVGFVWAVLVEMRNHVPALYQLFDPSGFEQGQGRLWFIAVVLVIFGASLIPMFNGESTDSRKFGAFTAKAERWNGRLAMIGFSGLILVEAAMGKAMF